MVNVMKMKRYPETLFCKCLKCGHEWRPRDGKKPVSCPKCKTYSWQEKRK